MEHETAIRTKFAPPNAILFMVDLEEKMLEIFEKKSKDLVEITYFSFGNMVKIH